MSHKNDILSRITIDLPQEEHKRLKALAALQGKSLKEVILESIEKYLYNASTSTKSNDDALGKVIAEVLKDYAPALEKLSKS